MNIRRNAVTLAALLATLTVACGSAAARADAWPMKHRDMHNTGRAPFVVPPSRMNDTFFDILRWQKRSPGSPDDGNLSGSNMVFFDGAGPGGADLVVCGYHWPKGIQGMNRHTGQRYWYGNPAGGETIGSVSPAFSNNGQTVYVVNDATGSPGHPLMAFAAATGPAVFWHNGANADPNEMSTGYPIIAPDGRIFLYRWGDRPYGGVDTGSAITHTWAAAVSNGTCYSGPAVYVYDAGANDLRIVTGGRNQQIQSFNAATGALVWQTAARFVDAYVTVDPANGNIYVAGGTDDVYVIGLNRDGAPLWGSSSLLIYDYIAGVNNPHRVSSAGCLSHDGSTYYFQTVSQQGDGRLFAVSTADGYLKWDYPTQSTGWEGYKSSPIVTPNGVVIVGNNDGHRYYALHDDGDGATLLDTLDLDPTWRGMAQSTPTLSADGLLYLPARITWMVGNGDGETPNFAIENLFNAFDLNAGASVSLPPPPAQIAIALNNSVKLLWQPIQDPTGQFHHYAIYRSTAPFTNVSALTPIGTVLGLGSTEYLDATALNGTHYYYAVTSVAIGGGEGEDVQSIGPRTPRSETDLQVLSVSRTPRFPRYLPNYTYYTVTEPSGFGPYIFSAATSLGGGQTPSTQRWPNVGDPVTYTATIRNSGTLVWTGTLSGTWYRDGAVIGNPTKSLSLQPGGTTTFSINVTWDNLLHDIKFQLNNTDARPGNNAVTIGTKSAPFLTYVDLNFIEDFREKSTPNYPQAATFDMLDWLQRHAQEMNDMFAAAGSLKRVHYDVLAVTRDGDPDPSIDRTPFGIFPFRYYGGEYSDPRAPGYYHADVDIDYGLCHEMSHQLGLIDIYQFDVPPEMNQVSNMGYSAVACMMHGCSPFYSEHSARAMTKWAHIVHGYYGQYLYDLPAQCKLRLLDFQGQPLVGATVKMYQVAERPGLGKLITDQIKAQGVTDGNGEWTLPNVPIDPGMVPATDAGVLSANPFGYLAVVGTNGVLHFKVEHLDFVDYAWLDVTEVNNAYWQGQTDTAVFTRQLSIGGDIQYFPPDDLAEMNVENWTAWAQDGTVTLSNDTSRKRVGSASIKMAATGGFDNYARYPYGLLARWNLSNVNYIRLWVYATNPNGGFQNHSPWIRLGHFQDGYFQWTPSWDILNQALNQWREFVIPINGDATWTRSTFGSPDLSRINYLQVHADTWGAGFNLWLDGVRFDPSPQPPAGDLNCDGLVNVDDIAPFINALIEPGAYTGCNLNLADLNGDSAIDGRDISAFVAVLLGY